MLITIMTKVLSKGKIMWLKSIEISGVLSVMGYLECLCTESVYYVYLAVQSLNTLTGNSVLWCLAERVLGLCVLGHCLSMKTL